MGFSEAVQWWEEWQLRLLVLASLLLQYFLSVSAPLRKHRIPAWFRLFIWLAYLGSDALAIYALAVLFNRHKKQEWVPTHRSSAGLEALWAPILLIHLGGRDSITAYNIEDNELWRRHVLIAVSQVTVAIYVFYKSWSGEKKLLIAAIFIFLYGVMKCFAKPWALKSASINSLVSSSNSNKDDNPSDINSLEKFVQDAKKYFQAPHERNDIDNPEDEPYNLFVDLAYPFSQRLKNLKYMVQQDKAHNCVKFGLSGTFDRLYTKDEVYQGLKIWCNCSRKGWLTKLLRESLFYLALAAIVLFHKSNKEAYNDTDVKITFTLLYCTFLMEGQRLQGLRQCFELFAERPWPDQVAQYNLIGYLARNKKYSWFRKLATLLFCKDYLDQLWCMKPCKSSGDITMLVHGHVKSWWQKISDIPTYHKFNDSRGQCTLDREGLLNILGWSLRRPFDESVLLWHLATDFCFHRMDTPPANEATRRSRVISNYMAYLLFVNPEMLMAGARRSLFKGAYVELKEKVMEDSSPDGTKPTQKQTPMGEEELAKMIIHKLEGSNASGRVHDEEEGEEQTEKKTLAHEAWVLAQELMSLEDEQKTWEVIEGVWVEMLCFSAGRCRGYLHAKSLGKGGEYLSYVWLLLAYMGMETSAEILQRTELLYKGDMGAANPASTGPPTNTGDDNNV